MKTVLLSLILALMPIRALAIGETSSPNMNLVIPAVGITQGPQWASDVNASFNIIDGHNHCAGSGVQIPPCGLNINSDLSFGGNNETDVNSVVFDSATGTPSNLAIYTNGTDLFYKNSNGTPIQITKAGGVNVSAGNIQNLPSTPVGGAGISWLNAQSTFQFFQDSGTVGANIDAGSLIIRYPGSYPNPTGNFIAFEAPTTLATGYVLTLPNALPTASIPSSLDLDSTGNLIAAGNFAISPDSGMISTNLTGSSFQTIQSVSLVSHGRPILVSMQPSGGSNDGVFIPGPDVINIIINRSGTSSARVYTSQIGNTLPPGVVNCTDAVAAGTYTYTAQFNSSSGGTVSANFMKLVAHEI